MFTDDRATIAALGPFLLCLAISQPMLQLHFTLAGVHRGAGDTWTPLIAATVDGRVLMQRTPRTGGDLRVHASCLWRFHKTAATGKGPRP